MIDRQEAIKITRELQEVLDKNNAIITMNRKDEEICIEIDGEVIAKYEFNHCWTYP